MPITTLNPTRQGRSVLYYTGATNWLTQVRNGSTGTFTTTYTTGGTTITNPDTNAIRAAYIPGRAGNSGNCGRTFLFFDLSSIPGVITAADLTVRSSTSGGAGASSAICVESTAWGGAGGTTTLSNSDYSNVVFSNTFSASIANTSWNNGANTFNLNATAIAEMNANTYLNVAIINYNFDQLGSNMLLGTQRISNVYFQNNTQPIELDITYSVPVGYGNDVINVSSSSIDSIMNVPSANIDTVINV
jgi:hypothetical protein